MLVNWRRSRSIRKLEQQYINCPVAQKPIIAEELVVFVGAHYGQDCIQYIEALDRIAHCNLDHDLRKAEDAFNSILAWCDKAGEFGKYWVAAIHGLGSVYSKENRMQDVEAVYTQGLQRLITDTTRVSMLTHLAGRHKEIGKNDLTEATYKKALQIAEAAKLWHGLPNQLRCLAMFYQDMSRFSEAELLLKRALIIRLLQAENEYIIGGATNDLARLYGATGRDDEANNLKVQTRTPASQPTAQSSRDEVVVRTLRLVERIYDVVAGSPLNAGDHIMRNEALMGASPWCTRGGTGIRKTSIILLAACHHSVMGELYLESERRLSPRPNGPKIIQTISPSPQCDLCGDDLKDAVKPLFVNAEMQSLVERGFGPCQANIAFRCNSASRYFTFADIAKMFDANPDQFDSYWRNHVLGDQTPWLACAACVDITREY